MNQKDLFGGDDQAPGRYSDTEFEALTGERPKGRVIVPNTQQERQSAFFDVGKDSDLLGQNLLFETNEGIER